MTEINEKQRAQPHTEHRLKGIKEDRDSLLPWYLKIELIWHHVTDLNAQVPSRATYQTATEGNRLTFATQTRRGPCRVQEDKSVC